MSEDFARALEELLLELEQELRALSLWSEHRPEEERLHSTLPFGLDTLAFHEWIQFVLMEKLRDPAVRIERGSMQVHPMAQEVYRGQWGTYRHLIALLRRLDELYAA